MASTPPNTRWVALDDDISVLEPAPPSPPPNLIPGTTTPTPGSEGCFAPDILTSPTLDQATASCEDPVSLGRHSRSPSDRGDDLRDARHPTIRVASAAAAPDRPPISPSQEVPELRFTLSRHPTFTPTPPFHINKDFTTFDQMDGYIPADQQLTDNNKKFAGRRTEIQLRAKYSIWSPLETRAKKVTKLHYGRANLGLPVTRTATTNILAWLEWRKTPLFKTVKVVVVEFGANSPGALASELFHTPELWPSLISPKTKEVVVDLGECTVQRVTQLTSFLHVVAASCKSLTKLDLRDRARISSSLPLVSILTQLVSLKELGWPQTFSADAWIAMSSLQELERLTLNLTRLGSVPETDSAVVFRPYMAHGFTQLRELQVVASSRSFKQLMRSTPSNSAILILRADLNDSNDIRDILHIVLRRTSTSTQRIHVGIAGRTTIYPTLLKSDFDDLQSVTELEELDFETKQSVRLDDSDLLAFAQTFSRMKKLKLGTASTGMTTLIGFVRILETLVDLEYFDTSLKLDGPLPEISDVVARGFRHKNLKTLALQADCLIGPSPLERHVAAAIIRMAGFLVLTAPNLNEVVVLDSGKANARFLPLFRDLNHHVGVTRRYLHRRRQRLGRPGV